MKKTEFSKALADLRPLPPAQNVLNFMQFFLENLAKLYVSPEGQCPLLRGILDPPLPSIIFTARNEVGQGNIFTGVCDSVHGGLGSASVHAGIPPLNQAVPQTRHPQDQAGIPLPLVAIFLFLQGWGLGPSGSATGLYCDNSTNRLY